MFIQQTISMLAKGNPEVGLKMFLEAALSADRHASAKETNEEDRHVFTQIVYELFSQSFTLYEEQTGNSKLQRKCIVSLVGALLACRSLKKEEFESLVMKLAQYSAKMLKKSDQCEMVALCSYLFFVVDEQVSLTPNIPRVSLSCDAIGLTSTLLPIASTGHRDLQQSTALS